MSTPRIGVLALQGDVREHLAALRDAGVHAVPVKHADGLAEVDRAAGSKAGRCGFCGPAAGG